MHTITFSFVLFSPCITVAPDSPDVIIVDESPPTKPVRKQLTPIARGPQRPATQAQQGTSHITTVTTQPMQQLILTQPSGQQIILPQQPLGQQYQIIQTVGGRAQIITRPIGVVSLSGSSG